MKPAIFVLLVIISGVGNFGLVAYIGFRYIARDSLWAILDPFLMLRVFSAMLGSPLFWFFTALGIVGGIGLANTAKRDRFAT